MDDPVAVGLSLGGTGHYSRNRNSLSIRLCPAGAMGGLAIGVTGILYVFVQPYSVASLMCGLKARNLGSCFLKSYVIRYYFCLSERLGRMVF